MKRRTLREDRDPYVVDEEILSDEPVIVERNSQPVAAVIPMADYEAFLAWRATLDEPWPGEPPRAGSCDLHFLTVTHHEYIASVRDVVEFPVLAEARPGKCPLRGQVVQLSARHHERRRWVGQHSFGDESYGARPQPQPDGIEFSDHDVDVDGARRNVGKAGRVELLACGVLPQHKPDLAAIRLDNGPPTPAGGRLAQQTEVRSGVAPSAAHMIGMQPLLDERQVIVRDFEKA